MIENKPEKNLLGNEQILLEQSIIAEGERLLKENPAEWPGFLNNFYRQVLPEGSALWKTSRKRDKESDNWNKKHRDIIEYTQGHSSLWLNQTPREFFETIDKVTKELDVDGEIRRAIDKLCEVTNYQERQIAQEEFEKKLIPIFARLVAMGYTRQELRE